MRKNFVSQSYEPLRIRKKMVRKSVYHCNNLVAVCTGDPIRAFGGDEVKQLLQRIDAAVRQRKFEQRPIGPIGSFLSLSDDRWADAVERAMGHCFDSFLVHSQKDLRVLLVRQILLLL